jgi:hypothetical protein
MLRLKQKVVLRRGSGFALAESPGAACLSRSCACNRVCFQPEIHTACDCCIGKDGVLPNAGGGGGGGSKALYRSARSKIRTENEQETDGNS